MICGRFLVVLLFLVSIETQADPVLGQWGPLLPLPHQSIHSHLLPTGEVMFWSMKASMSRLNTTTNVTTPILPPAYNAFCSGHSFLADGRLFVSGGTSRGASGIQNASIFDPLTDSWTPAPNMNGGRWYPTNITNGVGDVIVMAGNLEAGNGFPNLIPQVYSSATNTWRTLSNASQDLPLYPAAFLAPNGKIFVATNPSIYLDLAPSGGAWTFVATPIFPSHSNYGSAALYDHGRVVYSGGGISPSAIVEVIDLMVPSPAWHLVAPLPAPRRQHNITILPTGNLLVTGGSSSAGFDTDDGPKPAVEWDPVLNIWNTLATETEYRGYHSEALLLPDARVLSIGEDPDYQVFSPPYLFQAPRPVITSTPSTVTYGQTFSVVTPDFASITAVNWIRLGSVTHTKNMNQRINKLSFSTRSENLNVVAPSGINVCPPGHYMLFIIRNGVPSEAAIISIA